MRERLLKAVTGFFSEEPKKPECYFNDKALFKACSSDGQGNILHCPYLQKRLSIQSREPGFLDLYRVFECKAAVAIGATLNFRERLNDKEYLTFCPVAQQLTTESSSSLQVNSKENN